LLRLRLAMTHKIEGEGDKGGEVEMIKLRNNIHISNPMGKIEYYWGREGGARYYDSVKLPSDTFLNKAQILMAIDASNKIGARIPYDNETLVIKPLLEKLNKINACLSKIPYNIKISDDFEKIPWNKIGELIQAFDTKYLSLARKTKILHKKLPNIIPILDSILELDYCKALISDYKWTSESDWAVRCITELKKDIDTNKDELTELQKIISIKYEYMFDVSLLRLLDILIWSHFFYKESPLDQQTI